MNFSGVWKALKAMAAVSAGAVLYSILNWIPLIGATAAGAFTGFTIGGGFNRGFRHAVYAAAIGTIAVFFLLAKFAMRGMAADNKLLLIFTGWVFLVWNMVGIFLSGIAGGLGAIGKDINQIIPPAVKEVFTSARKKAGIDYMICPSCGQGNVASAKTCIGCGMKLP